MWQPQGNTLISPPEQLTSICPSFRMQLCSSWVHAFPRSTYPVTGHCGREVKPDHFHSKKILLEVLLVLWLFAGLPETFPVHYSSEVLPIQSSLPTFFPQVLKTYKQCKVSLYLILPLPPFVNPNKSSELLTPFWVRHGIVSQDLVKEISDCFQCSHEGPWSEDTSTELLDPHQNLENFNPANIFLILRENKIH